MGFGGQRLFDGGTATDSLAGSIFRSFWGVIAGALMGWAVNKGVDADTATAVIGGVGAAATYGVNIALSKRNKVNMKNGL